MPTFADDLLGDSGRLVRALAALVEEQEAVVGRLQAELALVNARLDRSVLRLIIFTDQFGRGAAETASAQREAENVNVLHLELERKLEQQLTILARFREHREGGRSLPTAN